MRRDYGEGKKRLIAPYQACRVLFSFSCRFVLGPCETVRSMCGQGGMQGSSAVFEWYATAFTSGVLYWCLSLHLILPQDDELQNRLSGHIRMFGQRVEITLYQKSCSNHVKVRVELVFIIKFDFSVVIQSFILFIIFHRLTSTHTHTLTQALWLYFFIYMHMFVLFVLCP